MQAVWNDELDARLLELLRYEMDAEPLDAFIRRVSPRMPPPAHLEPILDVWERTRKGPVRAVIELPPRHAKTTTCIHGLAWRTALDPALMNCYATYADALAITKSRTARRLALEAGVQLAPDAANVHEWRTTAEGGFIATGIGGPLTGKGITGVAVVDDAVKNREEAESRLVRDKIWEWFTDVLWTRLEDDASVLVSGTRWHSDDLIGRLVAQGIDGVKFERVCLPAIAEDVDPIGRQPGEPLWPERFPLAKLKEIRTLLGDYGWASLYQQRPRPKGSSIFKEPGRFSLKDWKLDGHRVLIMADPAASEKTHADYTVIVVMAVKGYGADMRGWIIDHFRGQVAIPYTVRKLAEFQKRYWGVAVGVEAVAGFKAVPQMLREECPSLRVLEVKPLGDKFTRAQPAASAWNEGRLMVPVDAPWAPALISELQDFTGVKDKHDDQVDAVAHAWNTLFTSRPPVQKGPRLAQHLPFG